MAQTKAQLIDGKGAVDLGALSISGSAPDNSVNLDASGRFLVGTSNSTDNARLGVKLAVVGTTSYPGISITGYLGTGGAFPIFDLANSRGTSDGSYTKVESGDCLGRIHFRGSDGTQWGTCASIDAFVDGATGSGDLPGRLCFNVAADGASSPTERMRITSNGSIAIGKTQASENPTTGSGFGFADTSSDPFFSIVNANASGGNACIYLSKRTTGSLVTFYSNNGTSNSGVGSISHNGSSTAYNTSSDYRLKENIELVTDATDRIKALKPCRFNFIADPDKTVDGFIAHEAQEVVPECVTGEKDAVDDEGNPVYQGIDQSKLVPLLTAALQEAIGEIESLKARVAALEGA